MNHLVPFVVTSYNSCCLCVKQQLLDVDWCCVTIRAELACMYFQVSVHLNAPNHGNM